MPKYIDPRKVYEARRLGKKRSTKVNFKDIEKERNQYRMKHSFSARQQILWTIDQTGKLNTQQSNVTRLKTRPIERNESLNRSA